MSEKIKTKKVSELPEPSTLDGFYAFGMDKNQNSVKVPIEMLKGNKGDKGDIGEVSKKELDTKADTENEDGTVARRKQNGFVLNPSELRKYDLETDIDGQVGFFRTPRIGYGLIDTKINTNEYYYADTSGWVNGGTDWKSRDLRNSSIEQFMPSLFDIITDKQGNVLNFFKSNSLGEDNEYKVPDKLSECFTREVSIVQGAAHYAFPGICAGKGGILHAFYRKGLYHTGIDGNVMYSYSTDYGNTWSDGVLALEGGDEIDGWFGDWRDAKVIRMSNGQFLLSHSKNYAKENGGTPPYHVDYDTENKCRSYAIIYNELSNGVLDIANPTIVKMPNPTGTTWGFGAGGLVERNGIIYITVYSNTPNSAYLFRSLDFGVTWELVSKIQDGYNENSIAFIGDTMFCILRNVGGNAMIVKSNDLGVTWEYIKHLDTYYHGMYALSLGDTIMIAGRAYDGRTNIVFMDENGNFVLERIPTGMGWDSSYADICTFENYVHIIYYSQLSATNWGIFTRKIERSKVLGLSY